MSFRAFLLRVLPLPSMRTSTNGHRSRMVTKNAVAAVATLAQKPNGNAADFGQRFDSIVLQQEVFAPAIGTWVEETDQGTGFFQDRAKIASFGLIADRTSEGQVLLAGRTAMLFTDDMIDLTTQ